MLEKNVKFQTTFWSDYSIADESGVDAVKDTYKRALSQWGKDLVYITEMVIVLNWKIWQHHKAENKELAETYNDLWMDAENFFFENFKDEESLAYYFEMTD